jgi:hypothetical protein
MDSIAECDAGKTGCCIAAPPQWNAQTCWSGSAALTELLQATSSSISMLRR